MRQLLTESALLVVAGIALGLIGQAWLTELIRALPLLDGIGWRPAPAVNAPVSVFLALLTLGVLGAAGAVPAANLSRKSIAQRARSRQARLPASQRVVVGAQIGIAMLVLSVAVLFALNQFRSSLADPGYQRENVRVVQLRRTEGELPPDAASVLERRRTVEERLLAIGGVDAVGFGGVAPGILAPDTYLVEAIGSMPSGSGSTAVEIASQVTRVNPGWYDVLQVRWLAGAPPVPEDPGAAVVSRRFAERAWGRLDVVGKTVRVPAQHSRAGGAVDGLSALRVAGVIEDIDIADAGGSAAPVVFVNATLPFDFGALRLVLESARFELAVRSAIGADAKALRGHALARGVALGLPGLVFGLLVSALTLGVVRREFELWQAGVFPALAICAGLLGFLLSVFVWSSAVAASRVEPSAVLRAE